MGSNYLITPKEFNGTDYDTLYFKTISQQVLLNDNALATKLGLSSGANLHDLLANGNLIGQIVSYTGTNEYGSSHPCSISFSFAPDFVMVVNIDSSFGLGGPWIIDTGDSTSYQHYSRYWLSPVSLTTSYQPYAGFVDHLYQNLQNCYAKKSNDGKNIQWYGNDPASQLNASSTTYYFLGITGVKMPS